MRLRKIMLTVVLFLLIIQVFAKEMNLYRNYEGATEFATLTLDEQLYPTLKDGSLNVY